MIVERRGEENTPLEVRNNKNYKGDGSPHILNPISSVLATMF